MKKSLPYIFDEFFASGMEESVSPFLTRSSRKFGKNLYLKASILAAIFLALSFALSFTHPALSSLFLLIVYFLSGTPALINALEDLKNLDVNIDVLMTLAALLSVVIGSSMEGALLLVLFEISGAMEDTVTHKTKSAIQTLRAISPQTAWIVEGNDLYEKSVKDISVGEKLLIKAGEVIPLDGKIIEGQSFVNLVHLTGESSPIPKKIDDEVQAGSANLDGTLTVVVLRTTRDSTLQKIIQLITQASDAKPSLERMFDKFSKWYASSIISLTFIFALSLPFLLSIPFLGSEGGIYRALTFLIAASPCALILATPTAYLSAISSCAKKGILLKGGIVLDALNDCKTIAFDKTGTLTTGKLTCDKIEDLSGSSSYTLQEAISAAAGLERHSTHPLAEAICSYAETKKVPPAKIEEFLSVAGSGLEGRALLNEKKVPVYIGQPSYIQSKLSQNIQLPSIKGIFTLLLIGESLFLFHFSDTLRKESKKAVETLRKQYRLIMLTGDHSEHAKHVAQQLEISEYFSDLRPEDKLQKVSELSASTDLAMIGDGINDAPALARAKVGISMGKVGSATAIEASDVVFLQDDLSLLHWLFSKANKTTVIVKQNLVLALGVIVLATTPAILGFVPLWAAVVLHEGGTVLVGLNSLRLLRSSKQKNL